MKEKVGWWRWLLVGPAAVGAFAAVELGLLIVQYVTRDFGYPDVIDRLINTYVPTLAFVVAGATVAPSWRLRTAGVLTVVAILLYGITLGAEWAMGFAQYAVVETVLAVIAGVIAAIHGLYLVWRRERVPVVV